MGIPVLIIGKSGAGKSTSMRNFTNENIGIINVLGKPLPFRNDLKPFTTDDYGKVTEVITKAKVKSLVVDDSGYLITNMFMRGHSTAGTGNAIFGFYNVVGDSFWHLIQHVIHNLPPEKIVYFMMHEDKNENGDIKPKTIGKILDEKVCLEGMFTIVLRATTSNDKHIFKTKSDGFDVAKTPIDMFGETEIDNDLKFVDDTIREYYNLNLIAPVVPVKEPEKPKKTLI